MAPLVLLHVTLGSEGLAASQRARERLDVQMDPVVNVQIRFLTERLAAAGEAALEGLRPEVQVHMRHQLLANFENFAAAILLTYV